MKHPISGADYSDPADWRSWLRGCSFYTWLMFVHARRGPAGAGTIAQFRKGKPRIMMLKPHLNLHRRLDPAKADENKWSRIRG